MEPNGLDTARTLYSAAYAEYQQCVRRVAQKMERGSLPSVVEVQEEAQATERLAIARRQLLDVMARSRLPKQH